MRLPTTLGLVVAATLLVCGGAFHTTTEHDSALRTVHFGDAGFAGSEEERGFNWASLKAAFSGKSADEVAIIKRHAEQFARWNRKDKMPYDIYLKRINLNDSHEEAMKWGLRFEHYQSNPSAYH